jgi:hypothetical protein
VTQLRALHLGHVRLSRESLESYSADGLENLKELTVHGVEVTPGSLVSMATFTHLTALGFTNLYQACYRGHRWLYHPHQSAANVVVQAPVQFCDLPMVHLKAAGHDILSRVFIYYNHSAASRRRPPSIRMGVKQFNLQTSPIRDETPYAHKMVHDDYSSWKSSLRRGMPYRLTQKHRR